MNRNSLLAILLSLPSLLLAQEVVMHEQVTFPDAIPAGGYSGITWLGDDRYAVVSDISEHDGFFVFSIQLDSLGRIVSVANRGFRGNSDRGHDNEGVAWCQPRNTVFVSGETDNQVRELTLEGNPTGKSLPMPQVVTQGASRKYGLEALTYNVQTHRFWTVSESTLKGDGEQATPENGAKNKLRLLAFDDSLTLKGQYFYEMDAPEAELASSQYAMGVSALVALDNGQLLVLEREFCVAPSKIGSTVQCRIYRVTPTAGDIMPATASIQGKKPLEKQLVVEWDSAIGLLSFSLANYEGMCLGPKLQDGRQVLVLISDSQNQYAGVLSDWFRTIVIE